ncbi:hypothetical protein [Bacteroides sedimenti]
MENEQENEECVLQFYDYAIYLIQDEKKSADETIAILISMGLKNENATMIVNSIQKSIREKREKIARKYMIRGALWCIGGLLITGLAYMAAANHGRESYTFCWVALIIGGLYFFGGLFLKLFNK